MSAVKVVLSVFVILFSQMVTMYQHSESAEKYFVGDWRITHVEVNHKTVDVLEEDESVVNCVFREDGTGEFLGRSFKWGVGSKFAHMDFGNEIYYARVFEGGRLDVLTPAERMESRYFGVRSKSQEDVDSATESATPSNTESTTEPTTTSEPQPTTERQTKWYDGWSK